MAMPPGSVRIRESLWCPKCQASINAAASVEAPGHRPEPGDLTICSYCGTALVFTETMDVREWIDDDGQGMDDEERRDLHAAIVEARAYADRQGFPDPPRRSQAKPHTRRGGGI